MMWWGNYWWGPLGMLLAWLLTLVVLGLIVGFLVRAFSRDLARKSTPVDQKVREDLERVREEIRLLREEIRRTKNGGGAE